MKVILKEDVENLGEKEDLKDVKPGYARNFLFPKDLAIKATEKAIKEAEVIMEKKEEENKKLLEEARTKSASFEGAKITIEVKADESGKLFGSLSEKEIAENINKQLAQEVDPKNIKISETIKKIGDYTVKIALHKEIKVSLDIKVVAAK